MEGSGVVPKTPNPWKMPVLLSTPRPVLELWGHSQGTQAHPGSLQWAHTATIPTAALPGTCQRGSFTSFHSLGRIGRHIPERIGHQEVLRDPFLELMESPPEAAPTVDVREAAELAHSLGNVCEGEGRECSTPEIKDGLQHIIKCKT